MTDSIYNIPDLRQKIKELTGEENFPLLREQDVIKIKPVILQYLCGWPRKLDNLTWCKMPVKLT